MDIEQMGGTCFVAVSHKEAPTTIITLIDQTSIQKPMLFKKKARFHQVFKSFLFALFLYFGNNKMHFCLKGKVVFII